MNLIGKSTEKEIWDVHITDSLELLAPLKADPSNIVVDIGSGGGLPAVPLSIMLTEKKFYLTYKTIFKLQIRTCINGS